MWMNEFYLLFSEGLALAHFPFTLKCQTTAKEYDEENEQQ